MSSTASLAVFWFLFLAGMGVIFPYQSLYFRENAALAGTQLGLLLAVPLGSDRCGECKGDQQRAKGTRGQVSTSVRCFRSNSIHGASVHWSRLVRSAAEHAQGLPST